MKLSEAIRLGAMLKPQGTGGNSVQGEVTCAIGAAADAIGLAAVTGNTGLRYRAMEEQFPVLTQRGCLCPVPDCHRADPDYGDGRLYIIVWHLNDSHGWTREQIADFIATVEPAELPQPPIETPALITA